MIVMSKRFPPGRALAFLLLLLLLLPLPCRAATVTVRGPAGRKAWYERRVPELIEEVRRDLGSPEPGEIEVELAATNRQFQEWSGGAPSWAAAVALPQKATLVVRLPALGPLTGTDATSVLRHELVHLLLPRRIGWGVHLPRWFEEGLAQVVGGRLFRLDLELLPATKATGGLFPLAALDDHFPREASGASLAYAEGESAVRFLLSKGGRSTFSRFLDRIRDTRSFDAALLGVYGYTPKRLDRAWQKWLSEKSQPWWLTILSAATIPFVLFVASLLVIGAWLRARRRSRGIYESLPE